MSQAYKSNDEIREFRGALGHFPTGVAIVTALADNQQPVGMTINSFSSISLMPALVAWCIDRRADSYEVFVNATSFNITVLAEHQADLAMRFATRGADKFRDIDFGDNEVPVVPGGSAWFKCDPYRSILLGDHTMLVCKVIDYAGNSIQPLVFSGGQFQQLARSVEMTTRAAA